MKVMGSYSFQILAGGQAGVAYTHVCLQSPLKYYRVPFYFK